MSKGNTETRSTVPWFSWISSSRHLIDCHPVNTLNIHALQHCHTLAAVTPPTLCTVVTQATSTASSKPACSASKVKGKLKHYHLHIPHLSHLEIHRCSFIIFGSKLSLPNNIVRVLSPESQQVVNEVKYWAAWWWHSIRDPCRILTAGADSLYEKWFYSIWENAFNY